MIPGSDESFFYVFPNGVLIDAIINWKNGFEPFPPSTRNFNLELGIGDTLDVNIHGSGYSGDYQAEYSALSFEEQELTLILLPL